MPRSFNTRRYGKPRIETQSEHALVSTRVNRNRPFHKRSWLGKVTPNYGKKNENENNTNHQNNKWKEKEDLKLSEEETKKKMWQYNSVSEDNPLAAPIRTSAFATRYPEHRDKYIRVTMDKMKNFLKKYGIGIEADHRQCSITVWNTPKTWDPYSIIKARDLIKLVARYTPFEHASKVMKDGVFSDIIDMGKMKVARNQVKFIRRRARLIGPNGVTLKAIELLTKCYVLVYGRTVCCIGDMRGIKLVRKIVWDCMGNIHPVYALKRLMVERELESNPELANEGWNRFLPTFRRIKTNRNANRNVSKKDGGSMSIAEIKKKALKKKNKQKRKYTPWPPAPVPSKIDIAMETGAYWNKDWRAKNLRRLSAKQKEIKHKTLQQQKHINKRNNLKKKFKTIKRIQKEMRFVAPRERDGNVIKHKLKNAGHDNIGKVIHGAQFKKNVRNINKFKNDKGGNNDAVKDFLL